jgi:hypothetical protein
VPADRLDSIRQRIRAGDREGARRALVAALRATPGDVPAWELLATLVDEPAKKADCYRQVLRVNPQHRQAAANLAALSVPSPDDAPAHAPVSAKPPALRCESCGGRLDVRFIGELRDKRAICPFCQSELDVLDAFQRLERRSERERQPRDHRSVDSLLVETRVDHGVPTEPAPLMPEIDDLRRLLREEGPEGLDDETVQKLDDSGFVVSTSETMITRSQIERDEPGGIDRHERHESAEKRSSRGALSIPGSSASASPLDVATVPGRIDPEMVIRLAGGAIPNEARAECPACAAVVPRDAARCEWCGATLAGAGHIPSAS